MQEHSNFFIKSERTVIVMLGCAPPRRAAVVPHRRHSHFNQAAVAPVRLLSPSLCSRCFERTSGAIRNGDLKLDRRSLLRSLCVHSSLGMQRRRRRQSSPSFLLRIPQQHQFRRTEFRVPKLQSLLRSIHTFPSIRLLCCMAWDSDQARDSYLVGDEFVSVDSLSN